MQRSNKLIKVIPLTLLGIHERSKPRNCIFILVIEFNTDGMSVTGKISPRTKKAFGLHLNVLKTKNFMEFDVISAPVISPVKETKELIISCGSLRI